MTSMESLRRQLLHQVAELTDRYGLLPSDYVVEISPEAGSRGTFGLERWPASPLCLSFTIGPRDPTRVHRYRAMLESLGLSPDSPSLIGEFQVLRQTLDHALLVVPPQ